MVCVRACVCVCVCVRARAGGRVGVRAWEDMYLTVAGDDYGVVHEFDQHQRCVCVCIRVREGREGERERK